MLLWCIDDEDGGRGNGDDGDCSRGGAVGVESSRDTVATRSVADGPLSPSKLSFGRLPRTTRGVAAAAVDAGNADSTFFLLKGSHSSSSSARVRASHASNVSFRFVSHDDSIVLALTENLILRS